MLSIIVPVFNTGAYLGRCIESLIQQKDCDIEIIVVDDGSNQETSQICDDILHLDRRIRVFHQKNGGVSSARNFGLSKSVGEYVGFVDSDDWVAPNMFATMLDVIRKSNCDAVYCDITTVFENSNSTLDTFPDITESSALNVKELSPMTLSQIAGSACRALYRKSILDDFFVSFPEGLIFSEDRIFNLRFLSKSSRIYYYKTPLYYRLMRKGSCVNSYHPNALEVLLKTSEIMQNIVTVNWGQSYVTVYKEQFINGLWGILYSILIRPRNGKKRYDEFKKTASCDQLIFEIKAVGARDIKSILVSRKLFFVLFVLMYLRVHL